MRHHVFGRKLGRTKDERKLLFRNLVTELILHGRLKTTVAKAKAVKPLIDKLVTKAKKATLAARRELAAVLPKEAALILANTIAPHFKNRTSGFSRIIYIGERSGDHAEMVVLEWTEQMEELGKKGDLGSVSQTVSANDLVKRQKQSKTRTKTKRAATTKTKSANSRKKQTGKKDKK